MKKKIIGASLSVLALALSASAILLDSSKMIAKASSQIDAYYSSVNGSGSALLNSINGVITDGVNNVGYKGLNAAYVTTDKRSDGYLYDIYSNNTHYQPGSAYASSYSNPGDGYNREHTIPKSWWNDGTSQQGSDLFIVLPSDAKINGMRSNYPYGITTTGTSYALSGDPAGNRLGSSTQTSYVTGTVFEPFEDRKGDLARTYFYAAAMYLKDGESAGKVTNWTYDNGNKVFSSSGNNCFVQSYLNMLLKWHKDDPVSSWEITRNDNVQSIQKNRNPFIDHPSWVDLIWGGTYSGTNKEDTSSGTVVNGKLTPSVGITSISKTSVSLVKGNTTTISATSSNGGNISWSTSNSSIVTISNSASASGANITLTGKAIGNATITARITISGQTYSKTCSVAVTAPKTLSSISVSGQKTSFKVNSTFEFGGTVTAHYNDSTTANVTSSSSFSGYDLSTTGNQTVVVSYSESSITKTTSYQITVNEASSGGIATDLSIGDNVVLICNEASKEMSSFSTTSTIYGIGTDYKDTPNGTLTFAVESGSESNSYSFKNGSNYLYWGSGNSLSSNGTKNKNASWTVSFDSDGNANIKNCNDSARRILWNKSSPRFAAYTSTPGSSYYDVQLFKVGGTTKTLSSISLNTESVTKIFNVNDTFSYTGLIVTAHYSDGSNATVTPSSVSSPDMTTSGQKTITVTYIEGGVTKTATYTITVNAQQVTSITATVNKKFYVGETISKSDITVKDNLNNTITDYTFESYQYTYDDAASGGALTNKNFTITYSGLNTTLNTKVQRKARVTPTSVEYEISYSDLPTSYIASGSERTSASGLKFIPFNCAHYNKSGKMQFKADNGYVELTQPLSLSTITLNNRETKPLTVYGSNTKGSFETTITGENDVYDLSGYSYFKVENSGSGAAYCTSITIDCGSGLDTAVNLSNYVMFEDTNEQCKTKFPTAKGYFEGLSKAERNTFMTSNDYVIATARERLVAWAAYHGKTITNSGDDGYVINSNKLSITAQNNAVLLITIIGVVIISSLTVTYLVIKKRKQD